MATGFPIRLGHHCAGGDFIGEFMKTSKKATVSANPLHHNHEGLPLPRLQLRWEKTGENWSSKTCFYELVMPLRHLDCRAEGEESYGFKTVQRIKLGETKSEGGTDRPPVFDGRVDSPFRDGAHAGWDSVILNLPVYATCDGQSTKLGKP